MKHVRVRKVVADLNAVEEENMPENHTPDDGHNHAHGGFLNRILGGRAEVIFAVLCGICLLLGWLGPKYGIMSEQFGFGLLLAASSSVGISPCARPLKKFPRVSSRLIF